MLSIPLHLEVSKNITKSFSSQIGNAPSKISARIFLPCRCGNAFMCVCRFYIKNKMSWAFLSELKHYYVRVRVKMEEKNKFQILLLVVFISGAVCHSNVKIPEWAFFQHGIVAVAHNRSTIGYPHVCT